MFICEREKGNNLSSYAFFKNYFDRVTVNFDAVDASFKCGKLRYHRFYKPKHLIDFYKSVKFSDKIIKKANELRNNNPVNHASSELLRENIYSDEILDIIKRLKTIMTSYIKYKY